MPTPTTDELLAHSAFGHAQKPDPYARHVSAVRNKAVQNAEQVLKYYRGKKVAFLDAVEAAAWFHDLGKLDPSFQAMLRGERKDAEWDHIDAGVAHLNATSNSMAAWLVRAHHAPGLPNESDHFIAGQGLKLRGRRNREKHAPHIHEQQIKHTDALLKEYLADHNSVLPVYDRVAKGSKSGMALRLALSCLVDADHEDTSYFEKGAYLPDVAETRWTERLESLKRYVGRLSKGSTPTEHARNERRASFFQACANTDIDAAMTCCKAPVGQGKTTALTAFLLQRAIKNNHRRLIIVAPFTNILNQTAKVLRNALVLEGENPDDVILEHHHRADFEGRESRDLAVLWRAPIILTTAVSFFETLSACNPSTLRRFHSVPGSAIFLDEVHAALPAKLWPQNWRWINKLASHWGCSFVLASGSLARFWEDPDFVGKDHARTLPELMPEHLVENSLGAEQRRVRFESSNDGRVMSVTELTEQISRTPGPRLVILNTVQNAAVVARTMRDQRKDVLHLSTALTPGDRGRVLERVVERLKYPSITDWSLVSTSCVEAGVDISFRTAFRERFSVASIIQVGGRVNRHGSFDDEGGAIVYDFALHDEDTTQHPGAEIGAGLLYSAIRDDSINLRDPADVVTKAMKDELQTNIGKPNALVNAESLLNYQDVSEYGRVIDADTYFVIVNPQLVEQIKRRIPINFRMLLEGSVQMWGYKIKNLGLDHVAGMKEVYAWKHDYDPDFLGYMAGVLKEGAIPKEGAFLLY